MFLKLGCVGYKSNEHPIAVVQQYLRSVVFIVHGATNLRGKGKPVTVGKVVQVAWNKVKQFNFAAYSGVLADGFDFLGDRFTVMSVPDTPDGDGAVIIQLKILESVAVLNQIPVVFDIPPDAFHPFTGGAIVVVRVVVLCFVAVVFAASGTQNE
jgi:hypothetical protein